MNAINLRVFGSSLPAYGVAQWVGVALTEPGRYEPLVRSYFVVGGDVDDTTSKPESLEITLRDVKIGRGVVLRRCEPLVLRTTLCDPDGCYRADVPGLEVPISAYDRGELVDAYSELVAVLWKEYALEDDANLTARGKSLKARLLRDYTEVG